jgi:methionine-rich copper-binding protein CopC
VTPVVVPVTPPPDVTPPDTTPPAVTITSSTAAIKAGETATITATFSEAPTSFVVGDLVSSAGAFSNFAVNGANPLVYTATFTPTAGSPATSAGITIASGSYTDAAGNAGGAGTTPTLAMDMISPVLSSSTPSDNATGVLLSSNIVLNFNESVRLGTMGNIVITNAVDINDTRTISVTDTTQVSVLGSTLTINPSNDLKAGYDYNVKFASGVVTDLAGNAFAGISDATILNFTTVTNGTTASPVTEQSTGNDIINGNQGSVMDLNPKTFDASAGADQYVFSAIRTGTPLSLPAAYITINHFDAATGDKLVFDVVTPASGLSDINTLYSVSDYGDGHVELIVNDDGNVQIIGLINLGNTNTIKNVTDLSAFLGTNAIAFI